MVALLIKLFLSYVLLIDQIALSMSEKLSTIRPVLKVL